MNNEGIHILNCTKEQNNHFLHPLSFEENLKDIFVRLIFHSDPMLLMDRKFSIPRSPSSQELKYSQYILVNTLIRDNEDHNND